MGRGQFFAALSLIVSALMWGAGCAASRNPCASRYDMQCQACVGDKSHVHVIFVESPVDLAHWGSLPKIADYVRSLGYSNVTYYDPGNKNLIRPPPPDRGSCSNELAKIVLTARSQDPDARFLMFGWSAGSMYIVDTLRILEHQGVGIDSVLYMDSAWLEGYMKGSHPPNVGSVATVYRPHTYMLKKSQHPPAVLPENTTHYGVSPTWHIRVPLEPESLDALVVELMKVTDGPATVVSAKVPAQAEPPIALTSASRGRASVNAGRR